MSKKTKTKSKQEEKQQFDPEALRRYHDALAVWGNYMQDPFTNTYTQQRIGMGEQAIGGFYQQLLHNLTQNALALGGASGTNAAVTGAQLGRAGRARAGMSAQNVLQNILFGENARRQAAAALMNPLVTGRSGTSESTQTQSGLGTWLPQVAGLIGGAALAPFTGGASLLAGGLLGGLGKGGSNFGGAQGIPGMAPWWNSPYPGFSNPLLNPSTQQLQGGGSFYRG